MASSQNLASLEPFLFRHTFPDSWISEVYARDTETLTRALQSTFSNLNSVSSSSPSLSDSFTTNSDSFVNNPLFNLISSDTATASPTPTASNVSAGSDPETAPVSAASIKRRPVAASPGAIGKATKRKSRASKRSQTTFITADPANFRQMVQQVTGVRFGNSLPVVPVLKPEPQRIGNRFQFHGAGDCLPTLDTSAFLLDHQQQQQQMVIGSPSGSGSVIGSGSVSFAQSVLADGGTDARLNLDCTSSFPTLESWN